MTVQASHLAQRSWRVPQKAHRSRLDVFLRACLPHLSHRQIEAAIRDGVFTMRGQPVKKGDRLAAGDELRFFGPSVWLAEAPVPSELPLPVIFEDQVVLALNKPAGIATHGFSGRETDSVANRLVARWPSLAKVGRSRWEPGIVHRLDRETSGVLLVAKEQRAFDHLRLQFRQRGVMKIYWALVHGRTSEQGSIDIPLAHDPRDHRRMRPVEASYRGGGRVWEASTRFRRIDEKGGFSLLQVEMRTGVTHQIRAHLRALRHPIVGDRLYGDALEPGFGIPRHFLHARSLSFVHPQKGEPMTLVADLPEELEEVMKRLKMRF